MTLDELGKVFLFIEVCVSKSVYIHYHKSLFSEDYRFTYAHFNPLNVYEINPTSYLGYLILVMQLQIYPPI